MNALCRTRRRRARLLRVATATVVSCLTATLLSAAVAAPAPVAAAGGHRFVRSVGGGVGDGGRAEDARVRPRPGVVALPGDRFAFYDTGVRQVRSVAADGSISALYGSGRVGGELGSLAGTDARVTDLPFATRTYRTADGALWLQVNGGMLRIDAATHRISSHWTPGAPGGSSYPVFLRRDGSLLVQVHTDGVTRVATAKPGWGHSSALTTLVTRAAGTFAEAPDGTLYEALGSGIYRHVPGGTPVLVAGTSTIQDSWERPDGTAALGTVMRPSRLDVDGRGRLVYTDGSHWGETHHVRVVSEGTVRTVWTNGTWGRLQRCGDTPPTPVWRGEQVLLTCGASIRAVSAAGDDATGEGRLVAGLGEADTSHRGSPTGTSALRGYLPGSVHQLSRSPVDGRLLLAGGTDLRLLRTTDVGDVVDVVGTIDEATADLGWTPTTAPNQFWRPALDGSGRLAAMVCEGWGRFCLLRRQLPDGSWRTLEQPDVADLSGELMDPPTAWVPDPQRGRVWFVVETDEGRQLRVLDLADDSVRAVPEVTGLLLTLGVLPDGRVLVSEHGSATARLFDPSTEGALPAATGVPAGTYSAATDGTVWVSTGAALRRVDLDGTVLEDVDAAAAAAAWGQSSQGPQFTAPFVSHPSGVLVLHHGTSTPTSAVDLVTNAPTVPSAAPGVTATGGDARATVRWAAAQDQGAPVTGYTVTATPGGASVTVVGAARSAVITGLDNGTAYRFVVTATNSVGRGPRSAETLTVTPRDDVPPATVTLGSTTTGVGTVTLRWTRPTTPDYAGVTVVRKPVVGYPHDPKDGTVVYSGAATSYQDTALKPGTPYSYAVFARDAVGNHSAGRNVVLRGTRLTLTQHGLNGPTTTTTFGNRDAISQEVTVLLENGAAVDDGSTVTLHTRVVGTTAWTSLGTARTIQGRTAFYHRPTRSSEYRVVYQGSAEALGAMSGVGRKEVRTSVSSTLSASSVRRGRAVTVSGEIGPQHPGMVVQLQRKTASGWTAVTSQKLSSTSRYSFSVSRSTAGSVVYRVVAPGHTDHQTGVGPDRTVRWT